MNPAGRYVPLVAVVVAAFLVGNLAYNVENLYWGEEQEPPQGYSEPESGTAVSNSSSMANALRYVFAGSIILILCGSAVAVATKAMKDKKGFLKSMGVQLLAAALIIGLFGVMTMVANPRGTAGVEIPFIGGGWSQGTGSTGDNTGEPTPLISIIVMIILIFLAVLAAGAFIFLGKASKSFSMGRGKDEMRQEAAAALARARDDLAVGGDYRIAVLRCYRDMVKLLSGKGVRAEDYMTAREFEALASVELGLGAELAELTALFEEARYSHHEVTEGERQRAAQAFGKVREALLAKEPSGTAGESSTEQSEVPGDGA